MPGGNPGARLGMAAGIGGRAQRVHDAAPIRIFDEAAQQIGAATTPEGSTPCVIKTIFKKT